MALGLANALVAPLQITVGAAHKFVIWRSSFFVIEVPVFK